MSSDVDQSINQSVNQSMNLYSAEAQCFQCAIASR